MKKILFVFILFSGVKIAEAQSLKKLLKDTLIWSATDTLQMEDFQGKVKRNTGGQTSSALYYYMKEMDGTLKLVVEALFIKKKSALLENSAYALKHEQGHFDLTEIAARRLRKLIAEKDWTKVKNMGDVVKKMYVRVYNEWTREQDKYDNETQHGLNAARQEIWNAKLAAELKELEQYATAAVDIRQ